VRQLLLHLIKNCNALVLVHLLMQLTEVGVPCGGLPAFTMLAGVNFHHLRLVLSEIKALCRVYLAANRYLEVLVGNLSILVQIELIKYILELRVSKV